MGSHPAERTLRRLGSTEMLASVLRRLAALAALLRLAACLPGDDAAVPSDVKYIRCGVCQQLITAVHEQVTAARKKSKAKKLSEESIQTIIESACKPSTEAGSWLKFLDMAETDGGGIQVEPSPPLHRSPHLSTSTFTCASTTVSASHVHLHLHLHLHSTNASTSLLHLHRLASRLSGKLRTARAGASARRWAWRASS